MREPPDIVRSAAGGTSHPDPAGDRRLRIDRQKVLQNLVRLDAWWRRHCLQITAETALLAGSLDFIPSLDLAREDLVSTAMLMLGEEYAAGFCDGFSSAPLSRPSTRRYVEGLDDGNRVGHAVRHATSKGLSGSSER